MESAWCAAIHYSTAWFICNHPTLSLSLPLSLSLSVSFSLRHRPKLSLSVSVTGIIVSTTNDVTRCVTPPFSSYPPNLYPTPLYVDQWFPNFARCVCAQPSSSMIFCVLRTMWMCAIYSMKFFKIIRLIVLCSIWILIKFQNCFIGG